MPVARLVIAGLAIAGCTKTFSKEAVQPNPLIHPVDTLRTSEPITIVTSLMNLEEPDAPDGYRDTGLVHNHRFPLFNRASFTMVSRDRLRFHVQVDHTWDTYADLRTWEVTLIDDRGHSWQPEAVEHARTTVITHMWDYEQRTALCDSKGRNARGDCYNLIGYADDGWKRRQPLGNISVYRGKADFVFYQRDLFSSQVRWLKLIVKRSGEAFEFTWRFDDTVAAD